MCKKEGERECRSYRLAVLLQANGSQLWRRLILALAAKLLASLCTGTVAPAAASSETDDSTVLILEFWSI